MEARLGAVAARDGWTCWLCGHPVDPAAPAASPAAPSVDHVVPRSRGGVNDLGNLRLAHRRCNTRRGSGLPELTWPADSGVLGGAPLWEALQRAQRRSGSWEVVGIFPTTARAAAAAGWVIGRAEAILGGRWERRVEPVSPTQPDLTSLAIRSITPPAEARVRPRRRRSGGRRRDR